MAILTEITIDWNLSPRIITVNDTLTEVTCQDLYDTCRFLEATSAAMDDKTIITGAGKEELGGGTSVGLTITLLDALLAFEARTGPSYTQCNVSGGNLVAVDGVGAYFTTPIHPTAFTQVVVTASSSATQVQQDALLYASYQNAVWVDSVSGDDLGLGNREQPVKTIQRATEIGDTEGFSTLQILNDITLVDGDDVRDFKLVGVSHILTNLVVEPEALCERMHVFNCKFSGTLDGDTEVFDCIVGDIDYINGHIHNSGLDGYITLGGGKKAVIEDCNTIDQDNPPTVDMGGSGQSLSMPNYSGVLNIANLSDDTAEVGVGLNAGSVSILPSVSAGLVIIAGTGLIDDQSTGTTVVNIDALINKSLISEAVMSSSIEDNLELTEALKIIVAALGGKVSGSGTGTIAIRDVGDTKDVIQATVDENGNRLSVTTDVS